MKDLIDEMVMDICEKLSSVRNCHLWLGSSNHYKFFCIGKPFLENNLVFLKEHWVVFSNVNQPNLNVHLALDVCELYIELLKIPNQRLRTGSC